MKKHLLFGLSLPLLLIILLLALSFPFINIGEELSFGVEAKIITSAFLSLLLIVLVVDGYFTKKLQFSFVLSLVPLLFLNNSFGYAFIYVAVFFYAFYLLVIFRKEPKRTLTYGLYNKTSNYIYSSVLALVGISLSVIFLSFRMYYFLFFSLGLASLLIIFYNLYYNNVLTKEKKNILATFKSSKKLEIIYAKYGLNMREDTISSISLIQALGYLLDGNYLEGAKAMDRVNGVKLFDISNYYELRILYDYLLNHNFNRSFKIISEYENYIKKIKSGAKRKYFYKRFDYINEFYSIMAGKKNKITLTSDNKGLDDLYLYLMNAKLKIKQDQNPKYENSGLYLLFF